MIATQWSCVKCGGNLWTIHRLTPAEEYRNEGIFELRCEDCDAVIKFQVAAWVRIPEQ